MTSLQQTAMLGGDASAKVASYVLVAADAGTAISMSNASATTITVNTGLFAAGDIVTIINLGAGVCTITAGTATVTTSGSLALSQNQGGVLRFTSASAAIFFQFATPASGDIEGVTAGTGISGGGTSGTVTITNSMATEITAKGDLIVGTGNGTFDNLPVGTNGHTLVCDSGEATGLKWAAAAGGGAMTLLATHSLSGSTSTISSISGSYTDLVLICTDSHNSAPAGVKVYLNGNTTNTNYYSPGINFISGESPAVDGAFSNNPDIFQVGDGSAYNTKTYFYLHIPRYAETGNKFVMCRNVNRGSRIFFSNLLFSSTSAITSVGFNVSTGSWSAGTVFVYGVK